MEGPWRPWSIFLGISRNNINWPGNSAYTYHISCQEDGVTSRAEEPSTDELTRTIVGRTRAARVTKYNEFHSGVRCQTYNSRRPACTPGRRAVGGLVPLAGAAHVENVTAAGANSNTYSPPPLTCAVYTDKRKSERMHQLQPEANSNSPTTTPTEPPAQVFLLSRRSAFWHPIYIYIYIYNSSCWIFTSRESSHKGPPS